MPKTFYFLSGLPRSGSTVLASILSQNEQIYVTPTSPLLDLLVLTEQSWNAITQTKANSHPDQLSNVYQGIINGVYQHISQPIIIDKHRGWPRNIKGVTTIFQHSPKIICTVRSIPDILASFLLLIERDSRVTYIDQELKKQFKPCTNENRCNMLLTDYIQDTWQSLKQGLETEPSCIHLVEYDDLVNRPNATIREVYEFLELDSYAHTFTDIVNKTPENDEAWGLIGLHDINPTLQKISPPAIEVLGEDLFDKYSNLSLEFWRK